MVLITGSRVLVLGTGNRAWPPVGFVHIISSLGDDVEEYDHNVKTQRDSQIKITRLEEKINVCQFHILGEDTEQWKLS